MTNSSKTTPNEVAIKDRAVVAMFVNRDGIALTLGASLSVLEVAVIGRVQDFPTTTDFSQEDTWAAAHFFFSNAVEEVCVLRHTSL